LREILDSRFLVTHYSTDDEQILSRTRAKLAALRRERRGVLPSIVIAEVMNAVCREGGRDKALAQLRALEHAGLEVVPLDPEVAREAGLLKCMHRDLPMADCVIAATALRLEGRVVTNDPHFSKVKGLRTVWI
jgi:predicted nucleic acid-binding protein